LPPTNFDQFEKVMRELGLEWDEPEGDSTSQTPEPEIGVPDEQVSTWVDVTAYAEEKFDALGAHASQGENIFFLRMGRDLFTELMGIETFVRVRDTTGAPIPEDDLFAGLR
jgi:LmbE family N-acetylglucosaminyl deacetylase